MTELIVYTKPPFAKSSKMPWKKGDVHYHEGDIRNPGAITEIRKNGCFALEPPVIQGTISLQFFML